MDRNIETGNADNEEIVVMDESSLTESVQDDMSDEAEEESDVQHVGSESTSEASAITDFPEGANLPPGESHVITGPSGRRFIAHIYEQGAGDQIATAARQDPNLNEGNMAKTLCLNLLNELVKGSYQLIKYKKKRAADDIPDEDEIQQEEIIKQDGSAEYMDDDSEKSESNSDTECGDSDHDGEEDDDSKAEIEPPFKKAKFGWQIKKSTTDHPDESEPNVAHPCSESLLPSISDNAHIIKDAAGIKTGKEDADVGKSTDDVDNFSRLHKTSGYANNGDLSSPLRNSMLNVPQYVPSSSFTVKSEQESTMDQEKPQLLQTRGHQSSHEDSVEVEGTDTEATSSTADSTMPRPVAMDPAIWLLSQRDRAQELAARIENETEQDEASGAKSNYLEKWQSHHIAKSIVDNAVNRTLEEMGLGPDRVATMPQISISHQSQSSVEDRGVTEVIRQRGLAQRHMPNSQYSRDRSSSSAISTASVNQSHNLTPIVSRLTEVSENIFVQNVQHGFRLSARIDLDAMNNQQQQHHQADDVLQQQSRTGQLAININHSRELPVTPVNQTLPVSQASLADDTATVRDSVVNETSIKESDCIMQNDTDFGNMSLNGSIGNNSNRAITSESLNHTHVEAAECHISSTDESTQEDSGSTNCLHHITRRQNNDSRLPLTSHDTIVNHTENTETPSTSFILDKALNAAITEKGLHLQ